MTDPYTPPQTEVFFCDQIVLRDLVLRAVIHEQSVNVCIAASLSVHIDAHATQTKYTAVDHRYRTHYSLSSLQ
jgi:hypothetical protein